MELKICGVSFLSAICLSILPFQQPVLAAASQSTSNDSLVETVTTASPDPKEFKFTVIKDGEYTKASGLPTYEWKPEGVEPKVVVIGIHGLTLHGESYGLIARCFAAGGVDFISMDMRGFGRCHYEKKYSTTSDNRRKINHSKSYHDIVTLAELAKKKHPDAHIFLLGESLGSSFCVRLAGEHPEFVDALILSGPAVKVNPVMYFLPANVYQGMMAIFIRPRFNVYMKAFVNSLVSARPEIAKEMLEDPLVLKELSVADLVATRLFVKNALSWSKKIKDGLPVLILQGSKDRCMVSQQVTSLVKSIRSADQTVRWEGGAGHLLLETSFLRAATIDALSLWIEGHSPAHEEELKELEDDVVKLGGRVIH